MSLSEIRNVVLLFSNPVWAGSATVPSTVIRNITSLSGSLGREETINKNLTTLTNTNAETLNGVIQGLLYVPEIGPSHPCYEEQFDDQVELPRNVTHKSDLPPTNYKLIAIAPWFSKECTLEYLRIAQFHPIRAFIFYRPNNATLKPQEVDEPVWDLGDGGAWIEDNQFPIFAIPGLEGQNLVNRLSKYSGTIEDAPHGDEILELFGPNPRDYIRIWTELTIKDTKSLPALWTFFVIVIGALLFIIASVSISMHLMQRRRRKNLQYRVQKGEVDLEAMGIAHVHVPTEHVKGFPLFTYQCEPDRISAPPTPLSSGSVGAPRSLRSSRYVGMDRSISAVMSTAGRTRTSFADSDISTVATNYQPRCEICLDHFENRISVIRQLPCGHIFHPECIDEYLIQNSSLCPICRKCMLPQGYSPRITNGMVRRERAIRRLRGVVEMEPLDEDDKGKSRLFGKHWFGDKDVSTQNVPLSPIPCSKSIKEKPSREQSPSSTPAPGTSSPTLTNTQPPPPPAAAAVAPASKSESEPAETPSQAQNQNQLAQTRPPPSGRKKRSHRSRPRGLQLQSPPADGPKLSDHQPGGRKSPSEAVRARMREIAPTVGDDNRPIWKKAVNRVFPGIL